MDLFYGKDFIFKFALKYTEMDFHFSWRKRKSHKHTWPPKQCHWQVTNMKRFFICHSCIGMPLHRALLRMLLSFRFVFAHIACILNEDSIEWPVLCAQYFQFRQSIAFRPVPSTVTSLIICIFDAERRWIGNKRLRCALNYIILIRIAHGGSPKSGGSSSSTSSSSREW